MTLGTMQRGEARLGRAHGTKTPTGVEAGRAAGGHHHGAATPGTGEIPRQPPLKSRKRRMQ